MISKILAFQRSLLVLTIEQKIEEKMIELNSISTSMFIYMGHIHSIILFGAKDGITQKVL